MLSIRKTIGACAHAASTAVLVAVALLGACSSTPIPAKAAPRTPADRVLVVVNRRSAASVAVGEYYLRQRAVARSHLVEIDVSTDDDINDIAFLTGIQSPIRAAIAALPVRVDFIVLTTGIPLRIGGRRGYSVDAHLAGMKLAIPPMVGFDTAWLRRYKNPYYGSREPFNSERYAMYLVTRLDCTERADCMALVDRSIAARPVRGPFFFDAMPKRGSDGYAVMNRSLYLAALRLQFNGAEVEMDSSSRFVAPSGPVMGYTSWGSNDAAFDERAYHAVRFLPGALAETFVSTSGRTFRRTEGGQSRIADLVAQGVTGVKGYVSEPFTLALADPDILYDRYARGFTLAESFYAASRMVLWKDIVVGDPLCAPYWTQGPAFTPLVPGASP